MRNFRTTLIAAAAALLSSASVANAVAVDLELLLLVDVSGSIDDAEYDLQKSGYVQAFDDAAVQALIAGTPGGIAVAYAEWSGSAEQSLLVGWTLLTDAASAAAFADAIEATTRAFSGLTAPGSAINWGVPLFTNSFEGSRLVIDVSGDGVENDGADTSDARDAAEAAGITINGLPIGGAGITAFYTSDVITSDGFVVPADDFDDFDAAIRDKLEREIVPTPASLALFGLGLVAMGFARRRG